MKFYLVNLLIFTAYLLGSCSKESITENSNLEVGTGTVSIKIDKENAPSNVVKVKASLSRINYDSITLEMNLVTEISSDVFFENVLTGTWHLSVEALNKSGAAVYKGETDVTVQEGVTTEVNLVLSPSEEGTGNIYIYVIWETESVWIDYSGNPVHTPVGNKYDNYGIAQPALLKENNKYLMWYMADAGNAIKYVFLAESFDGITWTLAQSTPVLLPGEPGSWDSWAVHPGAVIKEGNIFRMYYVAWSNPDLNWNIGLATSRDGLNWEKYPEPVLYGTVGWEYQIASSSILKTGNTYLLYYYGISPSKEVAVGVAASLDGIEWEKNVNNPVLIPELEWEGRGVFYSSVIKDGSSFKMVYMNKSANGFGMASSEDGINWIKSLSNPFFTAENTSNHWAYDIAYPYLLKKGNEYRIYYSGMGSNSNGYYIGFLKKIDNKFN